MGNVSKFDPKHPHTLPSDWKNKNAPTIYEILATLSTLKKMYAEQVEELEQGWIDKDLGEDKLRQIATNYQSVKQILFQGR